MMTLKKQAERVRKAGSRNSNEDSMLAHISPKEASLLSMYGGSGRKDPNTGLRHYDTEAGDNAEAGGAAGAGGVADVSSGGFADPGGSSAFGGGLGGGGLGGYGGNTDIGGQASAPEFGLTGAISPADITSGGFTGEGAGTSSAFGGGFGGFDSGSALGQAPETSFTQGLLNFAKNKGLSMALKGLGPVGTVARAGYGIATSPNQNQTAMSTFGNMALGALGPVGMAASALGAGTAFGNAFGGVTANQGIDKGDLGSQGAQGMGGGIGGGGMWGGLAQGALQGLGALYQGNRQANQAGQTLQSLNDLYSPNSPYAQAMRQTLARKDAAAGRNSQYGPREAQLMGMLAQAHGQNLTSQGYGNLMQMQQRGQNMGLNTLVGLTQKGQPLNGLVNQASNYIGQGLQNLWDGGGQAAPEMNFNPNLSFDQGQEIPLQPEFGGGFGGFNFGGGE